MWEVIKILKTELSEPEYEYEYEWLTTCDIELKMINDLRKIFMSTERQCIYQTLCHLWKNAVRCRTFLWNLA